MFIKFGINIICTTNVNAAYVQTNGNAVLTCATIVVTIVLKVS